MRAEDLPRASKVPWAQPGMPTQERAGGEISKNGTKDTMLTSCPWTDLRDDHWGVYICNFGVHQKYEQWQPDNFGQGWPRAYHATIQRMEVFQFWGKLWANFPINACKIKNFVIHKLRGLFL